MQEQQPFEISPAQDIDEKYTYELIVILFNAAREKYGHWERIGMFANLNPLTGGVQMCINVVRNGQHNDNWLSTDEYRETGEICSQWLYELASAGHPRWTSMFFGIDAANTDALWMLCYDEDYGPWKIHIDKDNWPAMKEALDNFEA